MISPISINEDKIALQNYLHYKSDKKSTKEFLSDFESCMKIVTPEKLEWFKEKYKPIIDFLYE